MNESPVNGPQFDDERRSFLGKAAALSCRGLKPRHGRIVAIDIVADHRLAHRVAHGGGRLCHGITAYINALHATPSCFWLANKRRRLEGRRPLQVK